MAHSFSHPAQRGDAQLWLTALALSALLYFLFLVILGVAFIQSSWIRSKSSLPVPQQDAAATIYIEAPEPAAVSKALEPTKKPFARTSEDQVAPKRDKSSEFIGERNTRATSDCAPDPTAKVAPAQQGVEPREEQPIETTESDYQDGELVEGRTESAPASAPPAPAAATALPEKATASGIETEQPGEDTETSVPPLREKLLEGPNPVNVEVPKEIGPEEDPKPLAKKPKREVSLPKPQTSEAASVSELPKPKAFSGFQRKTAVVGSISRTGRSALNVDDTALGRYQAKISKAVEQEWQRNCVRHRDFITPGFLTVRFFIETSGKVKSVQFVGDMETGEIQKGFTLNSIRDAEIPAMPDDLKQVYEDDSLELIFRFYF